jgi:hypothetical protein
MRTLDVRESGDAEISAHHFVKERRHAAMVLDGDIFHGNAAMFCGGIVGQANDIVKARNHGGDSFRRFHME